MAGNWEISRRKKTVVSLSHRDLHHSPSLAFSLFLHFISLLSCSLIHPVIFLLCLLKSPLPFSPHYIPFISSSLPLISLHIYSDGKKHAPLPFSPSYPVILSSLSALFLILPPQPPHLPSCLDCLFIFTLFFILSPTPLAPPLPPPALREGLLSSRLLKHSHFSGQGSTTAHFTHGRVCCMPVMYVCCWRWRRYSWLASETQ